MAFARVLTPTVWLRTARRCAALPVPGGIGRAAVAVLRPL